MSLWKDIYTQKTTLAGLAADDWFITQTNAGAMRVVKKSAFGTAAAVDTGTGAANVPTVAQADGRYLRPIAALNADATPTAAWSAATGPAIGFATNTTGSSNFPGTFGGTVSFKLDASATTWARAFGLWKANQSTDLYIRAFNGAGDPTAWKQFALIDSTAGLAPGDDNAKPLGGASHRWSTVYAGTGTINTSDEREKSWIGELTPAHLAAARRIAAEIGLYQFNAAIAAKGEDAARIHVGARAQRVWEIMVDEGLEDAPAEGEAPTIRHAFLCYDSWPAIPAVDEVRDEEGEIVTPATAEVPAGDRYGIRYDELAMFLIAAQEARLAALEAA